MFDKSFATLNTPRLRKVPSKLRQLRVLRASPEDVTLQIRDMTQFMGISLTFIEARELGRALLDAAELEINTAGDDFPIPEI